MLDDDLVPMQKQGIAIEGLVTIHDDEFLLLAGYRSYVCLVHPVLPL